MILVVCAVVLLGFALAAYVRTEPVDELPSISASTTDSTLPQGPVSKEVSFLANDGSSRPGTLSLPNPGSPVKGPAVLLISPKDVSHGSLYATLAEKLLKEGYAVFRFNASAGTADVRPALAFLSGQAEVDASQVGVLLTGLDSLALTATPLLKAKAVAVANPASLGSATLQNQAPLLVFGGDAEKATVSEFLSRARDPKQEKLYAGSRSLIDLINSAEVLNDILSHFARFLDVKG